MKKELGLLRALFLLELKSIAAMQRLRSVAGAERIHAT